MSFALALKLLAWTGGIGTAGYVLYQVKQWASEKQRRAQAEDRWRQEKDARLESQKTSVILAEQRDLALGPRDGVDAVAGWLSGDDQSP